ncbi:MAG: DNA-processing protein DprA [Synergistaceae bacterium]|nr:DNA-processing protein DprA [Synergistaceae bacterium]
MLHSMMLLNKCASYDVRMWERFEAMGLPPEAFVEDANAVWDKLEITERNKSIMSKALSSGWADRELDACGRLGTRVITCRDDDYPRSLLAVGNAPILLYVRGKILSECTKTIAVVGTRRCGSYGGRIAAEIGRRAAGAGWNVVSGGARGIDGASHTGCAEAGGVTAAVLGTGVDVVYPSEHRELFGRIMERGALYSEYPLGDKGEPWHFPKRNRIIAGLASRVVIVEAPYKSGAMITASLAADCGREVWAVPGRIDDARSEGTNRLILDGAMPLVSLDMFFEVRSKYAEKSLFGDGDEPAGRPEPRELPPDEKKILSILSIHGGSTIDNLADEAKMSAAEVFKLISVMSVSGLVYSSGPGRYSLND